MNISEQIIYLIVFILPGFLFITSFYAKGRISREDFQNGPLFDTSAFLAIALLLHILVGSIYFGFIDKEFYVCPANKDIIDYIFNDIVFGKGDCSSGTLFLVLMIYLIIISIISSLMGATLITVIENGTLNINYFHGSFYNLIKGKSAPLIKVTLLTDTKINNHILLYEGILEELSLTKNRKINFVVMYGVMKYLLGESAGKAFIDETKGVYVDKDKGSDSYSKIIVYGDNIKNIYFEDFISEL
ncbi:MAG: hypothetical protein AB2827_14425 [Candidatus Thiodiazotropha sp.]